MPRQAWVTILPPLSNELIAVLDLGSQYTQLIARRIREQQVYCRIFRHDTPPRVLARENLKGIILSGGPASVYAPGSPKVDPGIYALGVPVLGICYGLQLTSHLLGGKVIKASTREYGPAEIRRKGPSALLKGLPSRTGVWMSHGDRVDSLPKGFRVTASSPDCRLAAVEAPQRGLYGLQFHPEVAHTTLGRDVLANFLVGICGCRRDWRIGKVVQEGIRKVRAQVGRDEVVLGLSGGVDSAVVAALLHKAIGKRLHCIFVDNGLLRKGERELVERTFRGHFHVDLKVADASAEFLRALKGVTDPERKRKIIGRLFVRVFEREAKRFRRARFLAQGTLYPDVIESVAAFGGPTAVIKSHHNVGGLPKDMGFELVEPLRDLFKDEVRRMGLELGLPKALVWRQPFPGPGLAVRCLGPVTAQRLQTLREADAIVRQEIEAAGYDRKVWQAFAVLIPVRSVGVMGDERTYEEAAVLRAVTSTDGMTADWARLPQDLLARISNRIINSVRGVNRVVYDISTKPPSTIEWE